MTGRGNPRGNPQNAPWTPQEEARAIRIAMLMCHLMMQVIGPAIATYLESRGVYQAPGSENDPFELLKSLLDEKWADPNGVLQGVDYQVILIVYNGRNATEHVEIQNVLNHWETYLNSWEVLARALRGQATADYISSARHVIRRF